MPLRRQREEGEEVHVGDGCDGHDLYDEHNDLQWCEGI